MGSPAPVGIEALPAFLEVSNGEQENRIIGYNKTTVLLQISGWHTVYPPVN